MIRTDVHRLVPDQVAAANQLYAQLDNWQLADKTFAYLKQQDFGTKAVCLLAVIAINSLYATELGFRPGLRERIACRVQEKYQEMRSNSETLNPKIVEAMAKEFALKSGAGPVSFFFQILPLFYLE